MSENVFMLGAGASKLGGAPLMNEFLDVAERLKRHDEALRDDRNFDLVFRALAQLQVVHSKAQLDIDNLESVYGAFEIAAMAGRLGDLSPRDVRQLPSAMQAVIARTLAMTIEFHRRPQERIIDPPRPYGQFGGLIQQLTQSQSALSGAGIIMFNYDLARLYEISIKNEV